MNQTTMGLLGVVVALLLGGCWSPPSTQVQPKGPARLLQKGILVKSVTQQTTVESIDAYARTLSIQILGDTRARAYKTTLQEYDLRHLSPGAKVRATVTEELTIYVSRDGRPLSRDGQPPGSESAAGTRGLQAKILLVDPSYRLLTLRYFDGQTETLKVNRDVKLQQMQPGDDVMIQPIAVVTVSGLQH